MTRPTLPAEVVLPCAIHPGDVIHDRTLDAPPHTVDRVQHWPGGQHCIHAVDGWTVWPGGRHPFVREQT